MEKLPGMTSAHGRNQLLYDCKEFSDKRISNWDHFSLAWSRLKSGNTGLKVPKVLMQEGPISKLA